MDIKAIKNDDFLKNMEIDELKQLAAEIRSFLIDSISKTGGHLSSNLGDVELLIALHKVFDFKKDKLLFDVGHQCYTHKILEGKANKFSSLRSLDGLNGFISTSENPNDVFESGHSSTSISTAMGMAKARDDNKDDYQIISFIGDASIANGVAFEALNNISTQNNKIIIILNDNDMSINKSVGAFSKSLSSVRTSKFYQAFKRGFQKVFKFAPGFVNWVDRMVHRVALILRSNNIFDNFKISYLGPIDGHNFKKLIKALNKAKSYKGPILIHVKTKKGLGYKFAEDDKIGKYHGVPSFDINTGEFNKIDDENKISFSKAIASQMHDILNNDKDSYLISSAMVYTTSLIDCFNDFKDRCIDVGIAEEHSIALANGLAINNKKPFVSLYSTFMQRGYDEIVHDVCRVNSNVTFLIDRAGIVGEDGKTHQGMFDVSFTYPLENSIICSLSNKKYIKPLFDCLNNIKGPKFIRYQKVDIDNESDQDIKIEFGKFIFELYDINNPISLIVPGYSINKVKEIIIKNNYKINLINPIFLKPLDLKALEKISNTKVIVYDNTSIFEGFTSEIMKFYNKMNKSIEYYTLPNSYIKQGKYDEVLKYLNLNEEYIINKIVSENGKD